MRKLYHYNLCPYSRKIRIVLGEKKLSFESLQIKPWDPPSEILKVNPEGSPPVLIEDNESSFANPQAIAEYLDEVYFEPRLMGENSKERAETRRLIGWFDDKFNTEVTQSIVYEKAIKRRMGHGTPDTTIIRAGAAAIHDHLKYIAWLCEQRHWLAGEQFSMADITAAAHLSTIDYFGDVPWSKHPEAKQWYARIKSRPSFRPILIDTVPGITPSPHYVDLDF